MAPTDAVVPMPPTSPRPPETPPSSPSHTPPNSPSVHGSPRGDTIENLERQAGVNLIQALEKLETTGKGEDIGSKPVNHIEAGKPRTRASKLEYKLVDEVWDTVTSKYKIVDSAVLPEAVTDLDEYMFIVRTRTDKQSFEQVFYIDIKSDILRDVLKSVLRDVRGLSLREDKITLKQTLLYHYVPELEAYSIELGESTHNIAKLKNINLLVDYIRSACASTTSRLASLLKNREITYHLL